MTEPFDALIVGGGLAGLCAALLLRRQGFSVCVVEKNAYPSHKVCGEYISNESLPFLRSLGCDPFEIGAEKITDFRLTSPQGRSMAIPLPLGGFGISRYALDEHLYKIALQAGVFFILKDAVSGFERDSGGFKIFTENNGVLFSKTLVGAFGKRDKLDKNLARAFFSERSPYIGVKYHIRYEGQADNLISLHNFADGYCGISRIEDGKHCLCYLSSRDNLKRHKDIRAMEEAVLFQNPFLKDIFNRAEFLYDKPKTINEISFAPKNLSQNGMLFCGDAAGMIAPLCGNGMSMAMHGAKILSGLLAQRIKGQISEEVLVESYRREWRRAFALRLGAGRFIQRLFGAPVLSEMLVAGFGQAKPLAAGVVRLTHGKAF